MISSWIKGKINIWNLVFIFIFLGSGLFLTEMCKTKIPTPYYQLQLQAAQLMREATKAIKEGREAKGIPIDEQLDPNRTGLIGEEFTQLTTTLGNLSAKRTSTNPDFAALMVKYFYEANLKPGDVIAIGSSGSFPALILATLSACQVMQITPITIYALGASEYGATIPEFTFLDMLEILNKKNILNFRLAAISMGGNQDQAEGMFYPDSKKIIKHIAEQSGITFINKGSLRDNILERLKIYQENSGGKPINLFVNIGGASANFGNTLNSITFPNGLVQGNIDIPDHPEKGLIFEFLEMGTPVVHLLNIRDLAIKNGLPVDPVPLPKIGQSAIFFQYRYPKELIFLTILGALGLLVFFSKAKVVS